MLFFCVAKFINLKSIIIFGAINNIIFVIIHIIATKNIIICIINIIIFIKIYKGINIIIIINNFFKNYYFNEKNIVGTRGAWEIRCEGLPKRHLAHGRSDARVRPKRHLQLGQSDVRDWHARG